MYVTKRDCRTKYYIEFSIQPLSQACLVEIIPSTYRQYNVRSMKKKKNLLSLRLYYRIKRKSQRILCLKNKSSLKPTKLDIIPLARQWFSHFILKIRFYGKVPIIYSPVTLTIFSVIIADTN